MAAPRRLGGAAVRANRTRERRTATTSESRAARMAELTISAQEIRSAIDNYVSSYSPEVSREEVGTVSETGDGIAHVAGLPSTMTNELLRFSNGTLGIALNLAIRQIRVVILGNQESIEEGHHVPRTP